MKSDILKQIRQKNMEKAAIIKAIEEPTVIRTQRGIPDELKDAWFAINATTRKVGAGKSEQEALENLNKIGAL